MVRRGGCIINPEPIKRGDRDGVNDSREIREHLGITQETSIDHEGRIEYLETRDLTAFAFISVEEGSTQQNVSGDFELVTAWADDEVGHNMIASSIHHAIDAYISGTYHISFQASFSGSPNIEFEFELWVNGISDNHGCHRKLGSGGDIGSCSFTILRYLDPGDRIQVYVKGSTSTNITVQDAQLVAHRVGD